MPVRPLPARETAKPIPGMVQHALWSSESGGVENLALTVFRMVSMSSESTLLEGVPTAPGVTGTSWAGKSASRAGVLSMPVNAPVDRFSKINNAQ